MLSLIDRRITIAGANPDAYFRDSVAIIVFGSVAAGLDRPDSDIDVLCVGEREGKIKTNRLDFLAVTQATLQDRRWQQGELARHIYKYGTWLQGTPHPGQFAGFSEECISAKRRRVTAFMRRLARVWEELDPDFRTKYSLKVRREAQRLMLLESNIAIPPTRILDSVPPGDPERSSVCDRLQRLADHRHPTVQHTFLDTVIREWNRTCFIA